MTFTDTFKHTIDSSHQTSYAVFVTTNFPDFGLRVAETSPDVSPGQIAAMSPEKQFIIEQRWDMNKWANRLDQMRHLKKGWNGYSAPAPSRAAITTARSFLSALLSEKYEPSRVAPSVVGGVGITHKRNGRRVYVEFFNDGEVCALFSDNTSEPRSEPIMPNPERFRELTRRIREYLDA